MNNFSRFQMNAYLWGNYVTRRNKYRWRYKRAYTRAYKRASAGASAKTREGLAQREREREVLWRVRAPSRFVSINFGEPLTRVTESFCVR